MRYMCPVLHRAQTVPRVFTGILALWLLASSPALGQIEDLISGGRLRELTTVLNARPELATVADARGWTALHRAAMADQPEIVAELLRRRAAVNQKTEGGETPLFLAAAHFCPRVIPTLLEWGADPNMAGPGSLTPLIALLEHRALEVPALGTCLLAAGADIRRPDDRGRTPLHLLAGWPPDHPAFPAAASLAGTLTARGADPGQADVQGATPFGQALETNAMLLLGHFVDAGFLPTLALTKSHPTFSTPLHLAVGLKHLGLLERLASGNPSLDDPNQCGMPPLFLAVAMGFPEGAGALLDAGAKPDAATREGLTPLYLAILGRDRPLVRRLLSAGADPERPVPGGKTPASVAREQGLESWLKRE